MLNLLAGARTLIVFRHVRKNKIIRIELSASCCTLHPPPKHNINEFNYGRNSSSSLVRSTKWMGDYHHPFSKWAYFLGLSVVLVQMDRKSVFFFVAGKMNGQKKIVWHAMIKWMCFSEPDTYITSVYGVMAYIEWSIINYVMTIEAKWHYGHFIDLTVNAQCSVFTAYHFKSTSKPFFSVLLLFSHCLSRIYAL